MARHGVPVVTKYGAVNVPKSDDTDMSAAEFDRLFAAGEPVQVINLSPSGVFATTSTNVAQAVGTVAGVRPTNQVVRGVASSPS